MSASLVTLRSSSPPRAWRRGPPAGRARRARACSRTRRAGSFRPPATRRTRRPLELPEDELVPANSETKATSISSALLTSESMCSMASGVVPNPRRPRASGRSCVGPRSSPAFFGGIALSRPHDAAEGCHARPSENPQREVRGTPLPRTRVNRGGRIGVTLAWDRTRRSQEDPHGPRHQEQAARYDHRGRHGPRTRANSG
jgi:hypothetical protein